MNDAQDMVEDCLNVLHIAKSRGGPGFNKWERDFIESVSEQLGEGRGLTDKQYDTLENLWNRI